MTEKSYIQENPASILFSLSNTETHVDMYEPVVRSLRRRFPAIRCHAFSTVEFVQNRTDLLKLRPVFDKVVVLAGEPMVRVWKGLNTVTQTTKLGHFSAYQLLTGAVNNSIKRTLTDCAIQLVVEANDRNFPITNLIRIAHVLGIPSLLMQESIRKDEVFPQGKLRFGQGGCDRIAVWGESSREYFTRVGVEPSRITVAGNPRIDSFISTCSRMARGELLTRFKIPLIARVVLFATNPVHRQMQMMTAEQYANSILAAVKAVQESTGDTYLLVKPHQLERNEHRESGLVSRLSVYDRVRYLPDITLAEAIAMTDGVLIFNSTVAVEAALMGRQVGVLNLFKVNLGVDFADEGIATTITSQALLEDFVAGRSEIDQQLLQAKLGRQVANVGHAAEAITDEIISLTRERSKL